MLTADVVDYDGCVYFHEGNIHAFSSGIQERFVWSRCLQWHHWNPRTSVRDAPSVMIRTGDPIYPSFCHSKQGTSSLLTVQISMKAQSAKQMQCLAINKVSRDLTSSPSLIES